MIPRSPSSCAAHHPQRFKRALLIGFAVIVWALMSAGGRATSNPTLKLDASLWTIGPVISGTNYSVGMPLHPTQIGGCLAFDMPLSPNSVHEVTTRLHGSIADKKRLTMTYHLTGDGATFKATQGTSPARVTLFLQRQGDDWQATSGTTEFYRWWAGPTELKLGLNQQIAVDLDPANWSSVLGRNGTVAPAAFQMALAHISEIGFSFGGAFYAHGVFADKPAKFTLCDFRLD